MTSDGTGLAGRILSIATGHALSLALGDDGRLLAEHHEPIILGHAEALMPALRSLLAPFGGADADVSRIVVEIGPGSFTGLRIGHAAASALALAWDIPLAGIRSTLLVAAEARLAGIAGELGIALSAPRGQYWIERFRLPALESLGPPQSEEGPAATLAIADGAWTGSAISAERRVVPAAQPRAALAFAVEAGLFELARPLYVRADDAHGPG